MKKAISIKKLLAFALVFSLLFVSVMVSAYAFGGEELTVFYSNTENVSLEIAVEVWLDKTETQPDNVIVIEDKTISAENNAPTQPVDPITDDLPETPPVKEPDDSASNASEQDGSSYQIIQNGNINIVVFGDLSNVSLDNYVDAAQKTVEIIKEKEDPDIIICTPPAGCKDKDLAENVPDIDVIISDDITPGQTDPIVVGDTIICSCSADNQICQVNLKQQPNGQWCVKGSSSIFMEKLLADYLFAMGYAPSGAYSKTKAPACTVPETKEPSCSVPEAKAPACACSDPETKAPACAVPETKDPSCSAPGVKAPMNSSLTLERLLKNYLDAMDSLRNGVNDLRN